MEASEIYFVVSKLKIQYCTPSFYDDQLILKTQCTKKNRISIIHTYELNRGNKKVSIGETQIACVNKYGDVQKIPKEFNLNIH